MTNHLPSAKTSLEVHAVEECISLPLANKLDTVFCRHIASGHDVSRNDARASLGSLVAMHQDTPTIVQALSYPLTREWEMFEHLPHVVVALCIVDRNPDLFGYVSMKRKILRAIYDDIIALMIGTVVFITYKQIW